MALVLKDRVKETSTTTGTGTLTLAGASTGFQSFSVIGDANTTYYAIVDSATGAWEVGLGTYTSSGTTLSRDTVLESSTGSKLSLGSGSKDVFVTFPASFAADIKTSLDSKATQQTFTGIAVTGSAGSSSWTGTDPYTAVLTVSGMLSTDRPIVDIDLSGVTFADVEAVQADWALVYRVAATDDDELTLYATAEPTESFTLIAKAVR